MTGTHAGLEFHVYEIWNSMSKEFDCGNLKEYGKRGPGCFHFSYDDRRREPNELNPGSEGLS